MIQLEHLKKTFDSVSGPVYALNDISLEIADGEIFGIIGMSGAGKSTLVRCINMLERPTSGEVIIDGVRMSTLSPGELRKARRNITMIFQGFNLLMQRTCLKNICFPLEIAGWKRTDAEKRARELLEVVGLSDKADAYPVQLSGGQQQRIAIARALATDPKVLLCDEATSALDPNTTHQILELIREINRKMKITVIVITHQMSVVEEICDKVAIIDDGKIAEIGAVSTVFSHPNSDAAKRLVFPDNTDIAVSPHKGEKTIRVVFNGVTTAGTPIISSMAIEENIAANILYASTRCIGEKVYGNMILGILDDGDSFSRAVSYLEKNENVVVEEVNPNER